MMTSSVANEASFQHFLLEFTQLSEERKRKRWNESESKRLSGGRLYSVRVCADVDLEYRLFIHAHTLGVGWLDTEGLNSELVTRGPPSKLKRSDLVIRDHALLG